MAEQNVQDVVAVGTVHRGQTVLYYEHPGAKPQLAVVLLDEETGDWTQRIPLAILQTNARWLMQNSPAPVLVSARQTYFHQDSPNRRETEDTNYWTWRPNDPAVKLAALEERIAALERRSTRGSMSSPQKEA